MDIAQLTAFLAPFLNPLLTRTEEAVAGAVASFGEAAWERAGALWRRLSGRVAEKPAAQEAAQDVAEAPDSDGARSALAWQLEKLLASDPALRDEISRLWEESVSAGVVVTTVTASGERSVAVGGNVKGDITTGDRHDTANS
ncbi:hypothetical protein [Streptomyces mirabilis]|uniref:hypothetical protein n=1 Tax=Streptomyces mirabilis TaxID=68239 RepID=UPI00365DC109